MMSLEPRTEARKQKQSSSTLRTYYSGRELERTRLFHETAKACQLAEAAQALNEAKDQCARASWNVRCRNMINCKPCRARLGPNLTGYLEWSRAGLAR